MNPIGSPALLTTAHMYYRQADDAHTDTWAERWVAESWHCLLMWAEEMT